MEHFLLQTLIFLVAAVIAVPIAKYLGLGSILGYLAAGILIGPYVFGFTQDIETIMHFTEFGVVMMFFLVGLELKPSLLWNMRGSIIGMGGLQVTLATVALTGAVMFFLPWQQALALGLTFSLSSTAIVLQTLKEKDLMHTGTGKSIFSVLLFQDIAVIPILALFPLLTTLPIPQSLTHETVLWDINALPNYLQWIVSISAILIIFFVVKFASKSMFRLIASTRIRELFVATALALIVSISLLMSLVGLSPALGTFLAGVILADSEYRHELESTIEPFKGLLLGVFFTSIGASLNLPFLKDNLLLVLVITFGFITIKFIIHFIIALVFKLPSKDRSLFSISLVQCGGFAFVLLQFAKLNGILASSTIDPLISAVAISMFLTPFLFMAQEKICTKPTKEKPQKQEADTIKSKGHKVIIAGFGRLGTDVGRFLIAAGIKPVILDNDVAHIALLRKYGYEVYYGDVTRLDLLEAAGASNAELLIIAIKKFDKSKHLIELVKKHYPHLKIVANALDRPMMYELMNLKVDKIRRETYGSSLELGRDALMLLGVSPHESYRMMRIFRKKEEDATPKFHDICYKEEDKYISAVQQHDEVLEQLIANSTDLNSDDVDKAWTAGNPEE